MSWSCDPLCNSWKKKSGKKCAFWNVGVFHYHLFIAIFMFCTFLEVTEMNLQITAWVLQIFRIYLFDHASSRVSKEIRAKLVKGVFQGWEVLQDLLGTQDLWLVPFSMCPNPKFVLCHRINVIKHPSSCHQANTSHLTFSSPALTLHFRESLAVTALLVKMWVMSGCGVCPH